MSLRPLLGAAGLTAALLVPNAASATAAPPVTAASASAPSAPRSPSTAAGHGQVTVTWTAPSTSGGSPITAYRVRVNPGNRTVAVAAPSTSATITGLADGTEVTASVVALNAAGASPVASAGAATPTPPITTIPDIPGEGAYVSVASAADGTTYVATKDAIFELESDGTTTPLPFEAAEPRALAVAPDGDLYWIDRSAPGSGYVVRRLHDGAVTTVAGGGDPAQGWHPPVDPVPATEALLVSPLDLAISPVDGSVFLVDVLCSVVERFTVGGDLSVVAGDAATTSCNGHGGFDGDGGPAVDAHLDGPQGIAVDDTGAAYVADTWRNRIRRFTVGGPITTVAGDGTETTSPDADVDATATGVYSPARLAWVPGRGLLLDSGSRARLLVGDRLLRLGDDAYDRAVLESKVTPGDGPLGVNDMTRDVAWDGTTLRGIYVVPGGEGWHLVLKSIGPWLPAAPPAGHPGFGSWTDLVVLHHRAIVGRPPTTSERTTWTAALEGGSATPGDLDDSLRRSPENAANVDPIVRLYRAFLGRAPDASGLRFWIDRKRAVPPARTWKVADLAAQFTASSEFQRKYGSLTNRQFVTRIYTDVLGRPADPGGVDFWTKRLDTKRQTRAQVMVGFSESSEYRRKQAATTDVAVAYLDLVGRMPTAAETDAWVAAAAGGATHVELLDLLVAAAPGLV